MDSSHPNESNKYIRDCLIVLQLIRHSEQQIRTGKTINQKDVFEHIENKYFYEDRRTIRSINE